MLRAVSPLAIVAILLTGAGAPAGWAETAPPKPVSSNVGGELTSDFKYLANNFEADGEDIVTAPLRLDAAGAMLTSPRFYLVVAAVPVRRSVALSRSTRRCEVICAAWDRAPQTCSKT